ncbi:MAG: hypothetical protein RIB03_01145 [Henriciella sp.]|uniref:hypothetical protein n=1 Tax=Henriciella sp. TaxID=1968823 RepID=UPI0032EB18CC
MKHPQFLAIAAAAALSMPASAQIATSNEDGATGAYTSDVESSYTSEGRYGPRTAIDDLRAGVDKDREQMERVRQRQLGERSKPETDIEPLIFGPQPEAAPEDTDADPETD